jgi:hypothetical protein
MPWLWVTRVLWVIIFLGMTLLNIAAIVAHFDRVNSGISGGAAGLRAEFGAQGWTLRVDPGGPAAAAGMVTGDVLVAVDGEAFDAETSFEEVNRPFFGAIGDARTFTVMGQDGTMREVELALTEETSLQIWRRFRVPLDVPGYYLPTLEAILLAVYLLICALIFLRRSDDWLAFYLTVTLVLITPQMSYSWYYLSLTAAIWDNVFPLLIAVAVALTLPNFYIMPNGRFVPHAAIFLAAVWVVWSVTMELFPNAPFSIYRTSGATQLLVWLAWFATGMAAQVHRFRKEATPTERQQIKWVAFGLTAAVIANLGWTLAFELFPALNHNGEPQRLMWLVGRTVYVTGMMVLPISFGIAVFRYRLWEIDNLINRTLVYGTLTLVIVAIYAVVVTIFDMLFSAEGQIVSQVLAVTLNLIIFEPLRDRLQTLVDRLMFGEAEDLPTLVGHLGKRLSGVSGPDEVLPAIVETLAKSLDLPYVAIALPEGSTSLLPLPSGNTVLNSLPVNSLSDGDSFRVAAAHGDYRAIHFRWPLVYQRRAVGQLLLAPRVEGTSFQQTEWGVIEGVSHHISAAVYALLLQRALDAQTARDASSLGCPLGPSA